MKPLAALILLTVALPAQAEGPRHLAYLSAEASQRPALTGTRYDTEGFGGIGWIFAPRGLDHSGPAIVLETGKTVIEDGQLSAISAGWRWHLGRFYLSAMAGAERSPGGSRPQAAADLWWDDKGWMAQTRIKHTSDYTNARLALGHKLRGSGPFYGIEVATPDGHDRRAGLHATGLKLPFGAEARMSGGIAKGEDSRTDGYYAELSLWRRF